MKERYNVAPWNDGKDAVCKAEDGKYILYTDHLAEIREIVDTYDLLIDRCDKKNSELEDERDGYRNGQQQVQDLLAKQIDNSLKLAAENKRLVALNDTFPQEIARLEDRVSAEYEAERADDRARIQELEAEVGRLMLMNPCNHTGFESAPCDVCGYPDPRKLIAKLKEENQRLIMQRDGAFARWKSAIAKYPKGADGCCCLFDADENQIQWCSSHAKLRDENKRLRELVDGATEVVEIFPCTSPAQERWKTEWMQKAREALKEASHE